VDLIVVEQVHVGTKVADLHECAGDEVLWVRMKQEHGRALEAFSV